LGDDSCPFCKNERALEDFNSLADTHVLLIKEWSVNHKRKPTEFLKKIFIQHYGTVLPAMENILCVFVIVRLMIAALIVTTEKFHQESIHLR
jgi:hypothetical protein